MASPIPSSGVPGSSQPRVDFNTQAGRFEITFSDGVKRSVKLVGDLQLKEKGDNAFKEIRQVRKVLQAALSDQSFVDQVRTNQKVSFNYKERSYSIRLGPPVKSEFLSPDDVQRAMSISSPRSTASTESGSSTPTSSLGSESPTSSGRATPTPPPQPRRFENEDKITFSENELGSDDFITKADESFVTNIMNGISSEISTKYINSLGHLLHKTISQATRGSTETLRNAARSGVSILIVSIERERARNLEFNRIFSQYLDLNPELKRAYESEQKRLFR